jgi:hypothetical protein
MCIVVSMFMKVAITGHTGEIGTPLTEAFIDAGHEVVGISRTLGFDLTTEIGMLRATSAIKDCDVFVNLAYPPSQPIMLDYVWKLWEGDRSKLIINVGTMNTIKPSLMMTDIPYFKIKKQLDTKHWQLVDKGHYPKCTLVRAAKGVDEDDYIGWSKFLVNLVGSDYHIFDVTYIYLP